MSILSKTGIFLACLTLPLEGLAKKPSPTEGKPETISDSISKKMKDFTTTSTLLIPTADGEQYILIGKDNFNASPNTFVFGIIEELDEEKHIGKLVAANYVKKDKKPEAKFKITLANDENPIVSFISSNAATSSAESKLITSNVALDSSNLLEISLTKTAEIQMPDDSFFDMEKYNADIFLITTLSNPGRVSDFLTNRKRYGSVTGGAIYDIRINQLAEANLQADSDITGLVKVSGKLYKKNGSNIKKSVVKLFYRNASIVGSISPTDKAEIVKVQQALTSAVSEAAIKNVITNPDAQPSAQVDAVNKVSENLENIIK